MSEYTGLDSPGMSLLWIALGLGMLPGVVVAVIVTAPVWLPWYVWRRWRRRNDPYRR